MSAIACPPVPNGTTAGSIMEISKSSGIMKNLGPSVAQSVPPPPPSLPPSSSSNSVLGVSVAGHGHSHHPNSQTTTTTTLLLDANGKKKKKSHLSRDELARVCQHGDVTFEPYNGSSYMIAVRSQEERKSLIGYRCDWNGCGYMNARVERMFGHIRSQHPEAPTVKKLVPTTGGASPVTNTNTTATGNTGSAHCSTTQSNTLTGTGHADSKSTRLSLRSSSSLSNASSSITSPIPSLAALSAPPSSPPPPPPSLTCTVFSSPTTITTTTTSSTSNSTSLTTLVTNTSNTPTSNVDDNNNSGNSNSNTKHLFQQRLLLRKLSNYNCSAVTPTTITTTKCSTPLNSTLTENSCSRLVNLLQQRRRNSLANGPDGSSAINSQSTKPMPIKQEIVDDEVGEKEKNLTNQNCSRIIKEENEEAEFKCNEPITAETDTAQSITDQSAANISISADRSDEQSPENIMQQLKTITNGACSVAEDCTDSVNVPHCTVQPSSLCPSLEESKGPVAPSINTDPSTAELEMLDMEIESLLQLNNNNSATDSAAVTVGNTNSQKKSVTELPPPLPDGALANLASPVGSESKNYSLNPHHPHSNHHYSNSHLSPFIGVDSQQPIQQNRPVASLPNGYQHSAAAPLLPPSHHQSHPHHSVSHHQPHVHSHQHHLSPSLSHHPQSHPQPHPHSHPLHPHPQSHHQKFYSPASAHPPTSQQYGAMAPQSSMIVNSELFNSNHQISNQPNHHHHHQNHEMLMHDLESQSNDSIGSFATAGTTTTTIAANKPPTHQTTTAAMSPSGGGGGGGGNRSKKKSCSSKNYIGKQNLFQEFQSVDVTKVRDNENQYIIALQKDSKIVGYRCDWPECEFLTCRKYVMVNHINGKHTNQRPYSCPLCNFNFVKRYFLKAHMHKVHKRRDSAALCNGKSSPDLVHGGGEDEDEENSKQSSKNSTHNKNLKNSGSFASSLTDDGSNFDDDLMVVKSENNVVEDGFGDEFGSHLKKRLKTDCYDQQLGSMGGPGYYGNQAETTTTVQSGFVVNNNGGGGGGNYFDPYGPFEPHQSHMIHQQNQAACATAPIYDDGSQGSDIHLNNLMPNSGIQQAQRNFGYMDHSQQQQQAAYHHQRPNYCQNSFVGPRPNYPTMNCPVEMLTPPLTAGVITGSAGLGFPVSNNNNELGSAMGYSTNYQPNNQHQTINDEFNGLNTGFMINDEFLSPPSSISSISNGSSATSNNNNNNSNVLVPGSTTLGPLMNCRNVVQNGINPVLGPSNTPTSLANNSSFYLHTPSPSPSSLSHSPASANVVNGQYKTSFSNSFDLAVGTSSTSSTTSQAVKSVNSSPINNNQNWFSSVSGAGPNQTSGYHPTATGGQLEPSHQQPPPPFMDYSSMNNQPSYYTNSAANADSAYLNQGSSDPSINNNLGGMLDVIPLIEYEYDMSLDDGLSANLASTITGASVVGQQTGSIKSGSYNPAAQGTVATSHITNPASTANPNLYHNNNNNHSATTTVLDDCWNAW